MTSDLSDFVSYLSSSSAVQAFEIFEKKICEYMNVPTIISLFVLALELYPHLLRIFLRTVIPQIVPALK